MRLARLVETSLAVTRTRSRKHKVAALCACIRAFEADEHEIGVCMLAGTPRQGKIGLGYAAVHAVHAAPIDAPVLELREVDGRLSEIAGLRGAGANERRREALGALLSRATAQEQAFIVRLLVGELRQVRSRASSSKEWPRRPTWTLRWSGAR